MARKRWARIAAVVLLFSSVLVVDAARAPVPSAAQGPGFPEDIWIGFMGLRGLWIVPTEDGDVLATYRASGGFELISGVGSVDGEWTAYVDTFVTAEGLETSANAVAEGTIGGNAREPRLDLVLLQVSEPTLGMAFEFTAEELPTPGGGVLTVTNATCSYVEGEWTIEFSGANLQGPFTAMRGRPGAFDEASDAEAFRTTRDAFTEHGQLLLDDLRAGSFDAEELGDFFVQAEGILSGGSERTNCGGDTSGSFRNATTQLVASMMFELASQVDGVPDWVLIEIIVAGFRSGLFDAEPDQADFWLELLDERVNDAIRDMDRDAVRRFAAAEDQFGRTEQAEELYRLLEEWGS